MKKSNWKMGFKHFFQEYSILFVLILLIVVASIMSEVFLSPENLINIVRQVSVNGILAIGMTFVLISGYIDLSVGSIVSLCSVVLCTYLMNKGIIPAITSALVIGLGIGLLNGLIIRFTKARNGESLMLTLGMQTFIEGAALLYTGGFNLTFQSSNPFAYIGQGFIGGIPVPVIIFGILAIIMEFILCKTKLGRSISLLGANQDAAKFSGIAVGRLKVIVYLIAGFCASIAAMVQCGRTLGTAPTSGKGLEFDVLMAVIIGGTSMSGGEGNIRKTVLGVLLIGVLSNALNIIGVDGNSQFIVKGAIVVLSVYLDTLKYKSRRSA